MNLITWLFHQYLILKSLSILLAVEMVQLASQVTTTLLQEGPL